MSTPYKVTEYKIYYYGKIVFYMNPRVAYLISIVPSFSAVDPLMLYRATMYPSKMSSL